MNDRTAEIIQTLGLQPHPEGGHYREIYRSALRVERTGGGAGAGAGGERTALTTIYFLLQRGEHSRWHVVDSDEVWHFYEGDPLELITYEPETAQVQRVQLGREASGSTAVHVVPAGQWQAERPLGAYSLVGCTVGPGFEFDDFRFVGDLAGHERVFAGVLAEHRALL